VGIRELFDDRRRPAVRLPAGRNVEVPVETRRHVLQVAIHSSDGVRVRYGRAERHVPGAVVAGELPAPRFESVAIGPDSLRATLARGRVTRTLAVPLDSQPARGEGLSPDRLRKHFGDAAYDLAPGLFVNPTDLKAARRALQAAFEAEVAAEISARAEQAADAMAADAAPPPPTDADLLAKGPAAISRVTGMRPGIVVAPNGTRFEIVPTASGTTVRRVRPGTVAAPPSADD